MNTHRIARCAGLVCMAGATVQISYGVLAAVFPYPTITEPRYELLWALANVGMAAGVVGWLALDVTRPRVVAVVGGGLAILGHLIRIAISVVLRRALGLFWGSAWMLVGYVIVGQTRKRVRVAPSASYASPTHEAIPQP